MACSIWAAMRRELLKRHRVIGRLLSGAFDRQFGAGLLLRCLTTEWVAGWHGGARRGAVFQVVGRSVIEMPKPSSTNIATGTTCPASICTSRSAAPPTASQRSEP